MVSKKNNRTCIVCGEKYNYCYNCENANKPSWYTIFHDENCHDIYGAVANILPQQGKEAAKEALDKCDLSNKGNFHPNIIKSINEIYDIVEGTVEQDNAEVKTEDKENKAKETKEVKTDNVKVDTAKTVTSTSSSSTSTKEIVKEASKTVVNKTANEAEKKTATKDNKVVKK